MYRRYGNKLGLVFLVCDLLVTAAAWLVAYWLRFTFWPAPHGIPQLRSVLASLPMVLLWAAVAYRVCGLYEIHRLRRLPYELGVVCRAGLLLGLLAAATAFYRRDVYESRLAFAMFLLVDVMLLTAARRIVWRMLRYLRKCGLNYGRAVVVGTGRHAQKVAQTIINNQWTGLEAVGFVDRPAKAQPAQLPLLGGLDQLEAIVQQYDIDHVFIALPASRYGELAEVYRALCNVFAEVQLVPDVPNLAGMRLQMLEIDGLSFLSLRENPQRGWMRWAKRAFDVALAAAGLVLLAPLMVGLAVAVRLTSPGPVLFRQKRIGYGGRPFEMLKFRTMRVDAEQQTGAVWAVRNDPRCTWLGRIMRRWSLDELPQLFNVLVGDMSLVGPRPERDVFVEKFRKQLPTYGQRHQVQAGMTGWAQVRGWRGNTSLRRRLECDLYYVNHWSLWLDLRIILLTVLLGLRHRNAY